MNFIGINLKILRDINKLSLAEMADSIGVPKSTYSSYEYGKSEPSADTLVKISKLYSVDIFALITEKIENGKVIKTEAEGKILQIGKGIGKVNGKEIAEKPLKKADVGGSEKPVNYSQMPRIVTVNEFGVDNIIYVPVKAQAGYLIGYADPEYIESLQSFRMPGLSHKTYRMFEVQGVSMAPTLSDKDRVIAEWVSSIDEIRENRVHVIVHAGGVAIKRVLNRVKQRGCLYLKSDTITQRHDYPILEIDPADIREIWYVRMSVSSDLREPAEIYQRVGDLEVNMQLMMRKLGMLDAG